MMIIRYNALKSPVPKEWLEVEESERIAAVIEHHNKKSIKLPNKEIHASMHVMIENQAALLDETPVADTIKRLISEGIDRHESVHAVGSILSNYLWKILNNSEGAVSKDWKDDYYQEVRELTVEKWHKQFEGI